MPALKISGEGLLKATAWGVLCALALGGAAVYMRAAFAARWARVPFILLLSVLPLHWVFGFFPFRPFLRIGGGIFPPRHV